MININNIVLESLSEHFKKHWKKYALGLGSAALAGGTAYVNKDKINNVLGLSKPKMSLGKKIAIGAGIAGVGYVGNKLYHLKKGIDPYININSNSKLLNKKDLRHSLYHLSKIPKVARATAAKALLKRFTKKEWTKHDDESLHNVLSTTDNYINAIDNRRKKIYKSFF